MKKKIRFSKWLILPVVAVTLASMLAVGITTANFLDNETSTGNLASGWTSTNWTQTTQADFEAGMVSANLSTTTSPGSVILAAPLTTYSPSSSSGNWTNGAGGYSSDNNYATFTPTVNVATNNPSSNNGTAWTNPTNAYADGTNAANITAGNPSGSNTWGNYGFSLGSSNITQVRVRNDAWSYGGATSTTGKVGTGDGAATGTWERLNSRVPTADGDVSGTWTTAPRWDDVNKRVVDDATYMTGTSLNATSAYMMFTFDAFSIPSGATISSAILVIRAADVTNGNNNIFARIKVGGNYYNGGSNNPGTSFATYTNSWTTNPKSGAAWTADDINGVGTNALQQIGVYSTDLTPNIRVSMVNLQVTFTTSPTGQYTVVDETTPDDSDFLRATTNGYNLSTFSSFSIAAGSTITSLTVYYRAADTIIATAGGANNIRAAIQVNGTVYDTTDAGSDPVNTAYTTYSYSFATNPNTTANWTVADINGTGANPLQAFGVATNDANPDVRVSMYYAVVNYIEYNDQLKVDVSWDGGTSWSAVQTTTLTSSEATTWYDVTSATTWTPAKLANGQLVVRALAQSVNVAENVWLDWLPVEVTSSDFSLWPETYSGYGISLTGSYISTVEVGIEAFAASSEKVELEVTWNNGTNWSTKQTSAALGSSDPGTTTWFDFTSATSWTPTTLNNSNFKVRITYKDNGAYGQVSLDHIPVRITYRYASGTLASQVKNTGVAGSRWDGLIWDSTLPAGTSITFEVRASDTAFLKTDASPSWASIGSASPVILGLPAGQYKQWRAIFTTGDANTPTLSEVRLYYDGG